MKLAKRLDQSARMCDVVLGNDRAQRHLPLHLSISSSFRTNRTETSGGRFVAANVCIPPNQGSYYTRKRTCVVSASRVPTHRVKHPNSDDVSFIDVRLIWCQRRNARVHDHAAFGKKVPRYPSRT